MVIRTKRTAWPSGPSGGENHPVQSRDGVDAQLHHHAGEQDADGRRRDGVGVGEPEVERERRRLHQEAGDDQQERDRDEDVSRDRAPRSDRPTSLMFSDPVNA